MVSEVTDLLRQETALEAVVLSEPQLDWLTTYQKSAGYDDNSIAIRKEIMTRINAPKAFVLCKVNGENAGVGLGVIDSQWVGLFGLVTHNDFRRQGVATTINRKIGEWAKSKGVKNAYLQAEVLNAPALSLYSKMGFETKYEYWYRDYVK
jgi:ribosomal protein S18 acetylase RimI-like enzyme